MFFGKRRGFAAGIAAAALIAGTVAAAQPASALTINNVGWVEVDPVINSKLYPDPCGPYDFCLLYSSVMTSVRFQGPIGNETAVPKVGERFYVHVWTAALDSPFNVISDNYQMKLLLPEGVRTDIRTNDDVGCFVSNPNGSFKRYMASWECQDPVKVGVYDQFPAVALGENETANFWVPVVADRTFNQNATIGLSMSYSKPAGALPNPLYAQNSKLVVNPAPADTGGGGTGTGGTGTGGTGTGGTGTGGTGTGGTGTGDSGNGTNDTGATSVVVTKVPAKLVGATKVKSLTPKVCVVKGKGKKAKVSVIKSGKCKLTGKKGKKTVKATLRVTR